jgi:hypothetical protein
LKSNTCGNFSRVLSSLDWGAEGDLFLPVGVHDICADVLVKAHVVHCKNRNNLIAKSVAKTAKLVTKCPDLELQFSRFCWDLLIRLKISEKVWRYGVYLILLFSLLQAHLERI